MEECLRIVSLFLSPFIPMTKELLSRDRERTAVAKRERCRANLIALIGYPKPVGPKSERQRIMRLISHCTGVQNSFARVTTFFRLKSALLHRWSKSTLSPHKPYHSSPGGIPFSPHYIYLQSQCHAFSCIFNQVCKCN